MATSVVRTRNDKRDANVMGALLVLIQYFYVTDLSVMKMHVCAILSHKYNTNCANSQWISSRL